MKDIPEDLKATLGAATVPGPNHFAEVLRAEDAEQQKTVKSIPTPAVGSLWRRKVNSAHYKVLHIANLVVPEELHDVYPVTVVAQRVSDRSIHTFALLGWDMNFTCRNADAVPEQAKQNVHVLADESRFKYRTLERVGARLCLGWTDDVENAIHCLTYEQARRWADMDSHTYIIVPVKVNVHG